MKKTILFLAVPAMAMLVSCGTQKVVSSAANQSTAPFGEVYSMPCDMTQYENNENFAATGIFRGSSYQKGKLQLFAQENAKDLIRSKYRSAYLGIIRNYSSTIGNNRGNDISTKLQMVGDQILDVVLNDAQAKCVRFGAVGADGMVECYVGLVISKTILAEKVAEKVNDVLTPEEKTAINFEEYQFRKDTEAALAAYKEQKQK